MFDFIIIGAGITGVSLGRLLQMKGINNFIILEAEAEAGGLCRTKSIQGHYLDIGGGHFLCSKHQEVYDFIFSHIPKEEFNFFERVSKIRLESEIIDYPIESNLWQLSIEKQVDYLISLIQSGDVTGREEPSNYEQWIRWKLGEYVADNYMIPYNKKIWGVKPEELDIDWLHKIPSINAREVLESCLIKFSNVQKMPSHQGFYYPKSGGFQTIFDSIYKHLSDKVYLENKVRQLDFTGKYWNINKIYKSKNIINTSPWNKLYEALAVPKILESDFAKLRNNSIVVSLWEQDYTHDWHWCYDPNLFLEYHREFYIHNFAPHSLHNGMYTETNLNRWNGIEQLWSNNKKPIYEYVNNVAYPIPIIGHSESIKRILKYYSKSNLYGVGRWGQWQYFNSDVCIFEAIKFVNSIVPSLI